MKMEKDRKFGNATADRFPTKPFLGVYSQKARSVEIRRGKGSLGLIKMALVLVTYRG